jgi:hypothetical protein
MQGLVFFDKSSPLDMGCLQHLLEFRCDGVLPQLTVLPMKLRHLELGECVFNQQLAAVMPLHQLSALQLGVHFEDPELLLRLAQLPALQQLRLEVSSWHWAAAIAPAWGKLPHLCDLKLSSFRSIDTTGQQLAATVAGIAAATGLTNLIIDFPGDVLDQQGPAAAALNAGGGQQHVPIDVFASIAGLTRLQHLDLFFLDCLSITGSAQLAAVLVPGSVVALIALTSLTHLGLAACGASVGDMDLVELACCLKQLRYFGIQDIWSA